MEQETEKKSALKYLKTKYTTKQIRDELINKYNLKIKKGRYSKKEKEKISQAIDSFLTENGITKQEFEAYLVGNSADFPKNELIKYVADKLEHRTLFGAIFGVIRNHHPYLHSTWTNEDEIKLIEMRNSYGPKWLSIAKELEKESNLTRLKYKSLILKNKKLSDEEKEKFLEELKNIDLNSDLGFFKNLISKKLNINAFIVEKHLRASKDAKMKNKRWDLTTDTKLCGSLLRNNYFCSVDLNLKNIFEEIKNSNVKLPFKDRIEEFEKNILCFKPIDLEVNIEEEDIFWVNVAEEVDNFVGNVKNRFGFLVKIHGIKNFNDLLKLFKKLVRDCVIEHYKENLIENQQPNVDKKN